MGDVEEPCRRGRIAPLAPLALAVGLGIIGDRVGDPWGTGVWGWLAVGFCLAAFVQFLVRRWDLVGMVMLALAWVALGGAWHHHRWSDLAADDLARVVEGGRRVAWVRGVVLEEAAWRPGEDGPTDQGSTRLLLELTAIHDDAAPGGWRTVSGLVQTWVEGNRSDLVSGQSVEAAGVITRVEGPLNPGEFDPRPMLRGRGIRLRLLVDGPSGIWDDPTGLDWPWTRRLGAVRRWSYQQLATELRPDTLPLAAALLLGRREAVEPDVNDAFARTGTTHLLAISGLHLQVLAWVMMLLARVVGVRRRPTFLLIALGTLAYAALVGFAPSVVRSAAMTVGACLAGWRHRCSTPGNLLAGAALATMAWNPSDLFDVGCQLSFLAVAAVIWLVPEVLSWDKPKLLPLDKLEQQTESWWRIRRRVGLAYLRAGVIGSTVVWVAAWPLVALRFHLASPVAILANIPLIPLTSAALLLAGLTLAASSVWTTLGIPCAWACGLSLRGTEVIVRWAMNLPGGHRFVVGPPPVLVGVFYLVLAGATVALANRWPARQIRFALRAATGCGFLLAILPLIPHRPPTATADVWAVGHGLAVAVRSTTGLTALYDAGKLSDPHVGRRVIAPALWSAGITQIDVLILSHADADHFNGVPDLLDRFEVGMVRVPPGFADPKNPGAARLMSQITARGIPISPIAAGDVIELGGGLTMTARHPSPSDLTGTDNARSVVLDVTLARQTLLLTGDLEREGLTRLLRQPPPAAGIAALVAPHHGGRTANPPALYDWARPQTVAVSQRPPTAGARDPLAFLESADSPSGSPLRTWKTGAIRLTWTPDRLVATNFLDPRPPTVTQPNQAPALAVVGALNWPSTLIASLLGLIGGGMLALVVLAVEWGAWSLVAPHRRPTQLRAEVARPDPSQVGQRITTRAADGSILVGDWFAARGESPAGRTIALLHGLAEDRRAFEVRVDRLLGGGWNVAAIDARASGESGGKWVTFGGREADDLRAWLDTLTALTPGEVRFAVWGRSMGAATAVRGAVADPRIKALVLEAPYDDLRTAVASVLAQLRVPGGLAPLVLARARWLAGVALDRPRPIELAPAVTAPTLIVHGTNDRLVPLARARALAVAIGRDRGQAADFVAVPDAGHANVFAVGGDALAEAVVAFLDRAVPAT